MSDPSTIGAQLHGPGGLLSTPGLGGARRKKWGKCAKAACTYGTTTKAGEPGEHIAPGITRIRGNLCNVHGKYGPCDAGAVKKPTKVPRKGRKPRAAAKPKKAPVTPDQRAAAVMAKRQANIDSVAQQMAANDTGLAPGGVKALTAFAEGTQPDAQTGANLVKLGLAEQARDGSYRMTPTGRAAVSAMQAGDYQRTVDTISRGTDASSARGDRADARTARQQASVDKRTATAAQRQARQTQVAARRAKKKAPSTPTTDAAPTIPHATPAPSRSAAPKAGAHVQAPKGQAPTPVAPTKAPAVDTARNLTNAADATGLGDNLSNLDQFSQGKALRPQDVAYLVGQGLLEQGADGPRQTAQGKVLLSAAKKGDMQSAKDALSRAREGVAGKSFTVYKDHAGRPRWIARTTTAYQDRDNEIISEAALDADSARMTATKVFGPLRWWHVGTPDPLNDAQPWGAGLDIGDCDYSTLIGRTRVESGTFRNDAIAEKVARAAEHLEMSPGFFHPLDQPRDGVFSTIRTFERSLVPTRYARASNLFTGFTVKECSMEANEMERRFKAAITDLGLDAAQAATLGQQLVATEKTAQAQGIAFKEEAQPIADEITINGVIYKAFSPAKDTAPMADAGMTSVEEKAPPVTDDTTVDVMEPDDPEMEYDAVGDMSRDEYTAMMTDIFAPLIKALDISGKMAGHVDELKSMMGGMGGMATKEASEIAALKTRLAELEGRQPATILPDEVVAAMKSAGPSDPDQPAEPGIVNVINDPTRPWAGWGAATFPELYKTQA